MDISTLAEPACRNSVELTANSGFSLGSKVEFKSLLCYRARLN